MLLIKALLPIRPGGQQNLSRLPAYKNDRISHSWERILIIRSFNKSCFGKRALIFIFLVMLLAMTTPGMALATLTGEAQLQIESPVAVQGTTLPVCLWVNNPGDIVAGSFTLSYDPNLIEPVLIDSNTDGTMEVQTDAGDFGGGYTFISNPFPDHVIISATALTPVGTEVKDAILCKVYFKLKAEGVTPLNLSEATLSAGNDSFTLSNPVSGTLQVVPPVSLSTDYETYAPSTDTDPVAVVLNGQVVSTFLTADSKIDVQILDSQSQEAGSITGIPVAADGKFTGTWTIPTDLATGTYSLQAVYNGYTYSNLDSFSVGNVEECFIATAAFGSKFEPAVVLLRHFRDAYLLTNQPGRALVNFYYRNSPPVAAYIADNPALKALVRAALAPVIGVVYLIFHPGLFYMLLGLLIFYFWAWKRKHVPFSD